ncbi:PIN domain-containing protein [Ideonella sp. DXS22W]|uniref:PIN domain-containing protein n=1 Tax=Pseudaquabacterium inlustre TaxID=2984192 RepID=A0ABU9CJE4_9BURK
MSGITGVLVDTAVWVDHFRRRNEALVALLERDLVLMHPLVLGELACGTPPERQRTLVDLADLRPAQQASLREVMGFIDREQLYGLGCGLIDLTLLASSRLTPGAALWTLDRRLATLAARLNVRFAGA